MKEGPASIGYRVFVQPFRGGRRSEPEAGKRKPERAFDMPEETDWPGNSMNRLTRQDFELLERQGQRLEVFSNSEEFLGNFGERETPALPTKPNGLVVFARAPARAYYSFRLRRPRRSAVNAQQSTIFLTLGHAQQPGPNPR